MLRCDLCSVHMQNEDCLQKHLAGKKHLKNLRIKHNVESAEKSVLVAPLPKFIHLDELLVFFASFGRILRYKYRPNSLLLEFETRESADLLLKKPVLIQNVRLNIRQKQVFNDSKNQGKGNDGTEKDDGPLSYHSLKDIFEKETTFDEQLIAFLSAIQLSDVDVDTRYESVCAQLDKIFKWSFPNCAVHKFGSTQTGLAFKGSDLDIYMDIGYPVSDSKEASSNSWTMNRIFKEVKKIMYRTNWVFSNIVPIPRAKMPIIKFCHVQTGVWCDISFKNALGVYNSGLIKYYLSLDVRLKPLMMLIKYWARHFKISGTGKLTNYALIMLVIFYLQQPTVNILPPLLKLQKDCEQIDVNGWQVNFDQNIELPQITNTMTVPQLLHGFFSFYGSFEFKSKVICPLDAMIHTEDEFNNIDNLPEYMNRYKDYVKGEDNMKFDASRPMCVQDPIELNHNVTAGTSVRIVEILQNHCNLGAEICTSTSKTDYNDLLQTLLTTALKKPQKTKVKIVIPPGRFLRAGLPKDLETRTDIVDKNQFIKDNWYFTVFRIIRDFLEKVLKVQVQVLSTDNEAKQQKLEVLSDVHTKDHQTIVLLCTGTKCVWHNRKRSSAELDPTLPCLEREALVSDNIIDELQKKDNAYEIKLNFTCTFEKNQNPVQVVLTLAEKESENDMFMQCMNFIRSKLHKVINTTLLHMLQFGHTNH